MTQYRRMDGRTYNWSKREKMIYILLNYTQTQPNLDLSRHIVWLSKEINFTHFNLFTCSSKSTISFICLGFVIQ